MKVTSGDTILFASNDLSEVVEFLETLPNTPLPGPDLTVTDLY